MQIDVLGIKDVQAKDATTMNDHGQLGGVALAWFVQTDWPVARERWVELQEIGLPVDHREYSRHMQGRLLALAKANLPNIHVAPLTVTGLETYARENGADPGTGETRSAYAAELLRTGQAISWPPERNASCWCGSERKYKTCCMSAPIKEN